MDHMHDTCQTLFAKIFVEDQVLRKSWHSDAPKILQLVDV